MLKTIITIILSIAAVAAAIIIIRSRRKAYAEKMRAAAILLRESELDGSLKKYYAGKEGRNRFILQLSWKDSANRSYVFDPTMPIRIGRDPNLNQISIRQDTVSAEHCRLIMYNGGLTVQDMNSANGTYIKRGFRRYKVEGRVYAKNRDVLVIGGLDIKVHLFIFDAAYI